MQIIRAPSIYDQREAERQEAARKKRRFWPLWLVGGPAVIAAATALAAPRIGADAWQDAAWLIATWVVIVLLYTVLAWAGGQSQGEAGEAGALKALSSLGDDWTAIVNLRIPGYERIGDVDIILVGPPGVVAVEVKNLRGPWRVERDYWVRLGDGVPNLRRGVGSQLKSQVNAVTAFLGRQGSPCRVSGVIAVNSNAAIEIAVPGPFPIVPYDKLAAAVADPQAHQAAAPDITKARETLCSIATMT